MTTPPRWTDDLFPFPTPPALAKVIDIAWEEGFLATDLYEEGLYDAPRVQTSPALPFELCEVPLAPPGWEYCYAGEAFRRHHVPFMSVPELLPFADLGNGTCVGWVVPAPELGRTDHPVASFGHKNPGIVGRNTSEGLTFLLALALRGGGERRRAQVVRLAAELGIHPTPEHGINPDGSDAEIPLDLAPPTGWRHEPDPAGIGIGVLAPEDAFADEIPAFTGETDDILADAARMLDVGCPASALLGLTAAYHDDVERLPDLHPLWARAYADLGRPLLRARLDSMLENR
ncbi:hypothetical protein SAMN02982929_05346 [Saccharopolyspora kobensis]|uniref:Uncharacterized protein n=1 Tax=Saccharopolyspora kobensis TaxID=146035 RepID=A0A1H6E168_9PSEU|nr:hypothetical protein [Saccharopolyspora kobensis]SEG90924.1 hypothetical protein SAMN02982929_05346 [Saccharopolyspora kobensis]SFD94767.1 hypothetical protein SAMN05216506_107322 [Saccharopolyspora kobensis]